MSAFLCSDCHITALCAYALRHGLAGRLVLDDQIDIDPLVELGNMLKRENAKSLRERYPSAEIVKSWPSIDEPFARCQHAPSRFLPHFHDPMAIVKAAHCFAYQSCEHNGWDESNLIRELVEAIAHHATLATPEYEARAWGFECTHPSSTTAQNSAGPDKSPAPPTPTWSQLSAVEAFYALKREELGDPLDRGEGFEHDSDFDTDNQQPEE